MIYLAEGITEDLNLDAIPNQTFIEQVIANFDWNAISQTLVVAAIRIAFSLIIFLIVHLIAKWAINLLFKRFLESKATDHKRYETIFSVVQNVYRTIFYFFLIYTILDIFNFPVGTLLASAGVVGLAISFGAQGFVSDLVNGFTILGGRQLSIGDHVMIEDIEGNVLNLGLRTTEIKDFDKCIEEIYYILFDSNQYVRKTARRSGLIEETSCTAWTLCRAGSDLCTSGRLHSVRRRRGCIRFGRKDRWKKDRDKYRRHNLGCTDRRG